MDYSHHVNNKKLTIISKATTVRIHIYMDISKAANMLNIYKFLNLWGIF